MAEKKARTFDLDAVFQQAKLAAMERSQKVLAEREQQEEEILSNQNVIKLEGQPSRAAVNRSSLSSSDGGDTDSENNVIGPPLPPDKNSAESDGSSEDEFTGPPMPPSKAASKDDDDISESKDGQHSLALVDDGDKRESDEDDVSVEKMLPISHEITLDHGSRSLSALTLDPNGARLATGSYDYDVKLWDFAGMDASLHSFRTLRPCESHQIKSLQYSITGDCILIAGGNAQAKVIDRDGFEKMECAKGDQYIRDMANTKGHCGMLNCACWHPRDRDEFMTCSIDTSVRLWSLQQEGKKHKNIIKPRSKTGLQTMPSTCCYSPDGYLVSAACVDGSIQMWDHRKNFVNTAIVCREAHQVSSETSCICFSYDGRVLASRGGDDTLKLWDLRQLKKPLHVVNDLTNFFPMTDCIFSPNDKMVVTGTSVKKGEGRGKLMFYNRDTFVKDYEMDVSTEASIIRCLWHPKLNQIIIGTAEGQAKIFYDPDKSHRGALLSVVKNKRKTKQIQYLAKDPIITPHALPMFRTEKEKSTKKVKEKARADPVKSRRPELPVAGPGMGGRLGSSGGTLAAHISKMHALEKPVTDDSLDPREAIIRHAKEAADNPMWTNVWSKTQPKPIFYKEDEKDDDDDDEHLPPWKRKKV